MYNLFLDGVLAFSGSLADCLSFADEFPDFAARIVPA
jgi:hypothetical protein